MDFNPSEAAEPAGPKLVPPGLHELRVREAEERVSSKGNPMIALELEVSGYPGVTIREYLVASPGALFRVEEFCEAAGLTEQFKSGRLGEADCIGIRIAGEIEIEDGTNGYSDKNRVTKYHRSSAPASAPAAPVTTAHQPVDVSDIPF